MYYFDHSATTPLLPEVSELINNINREIYGNPSSVYSLGRKSRSIIENARNQVANSISENPEQIIFTSGGTESNNHILWSLLKNNRNHVISNNRHFSLSPDIFIKEQHSYHPLSIHLQHSLVLPSYH